MSGQPKGVNADEPLSTKEPGFESRVFGRYGAVVRYFSGTVSVFTMCLIAYMDAVTTRISVQGGHGWPSEWHFMIMTVGVTICAMSFSNANKTISTILSNGNLRDKAKNILLSRFQPAAAAAAPMSYHWWNAESKSYLMLSDVTDLSAAGFVRVPTARPTPNSEWDAVSQTWIATTEVK